MRYLFEIGCGFSVFVNTIFGGSYTDTVSGGLRKVKLEHAGLIPWSRPIPRILAWLLDTVVPDHLEHKDKGGAA